MKAINRIWLLAALAACTACGGKEEKATSIEERAYQLDVDKETGVQKMQPSTSQGNAVVNGAEYHYTIVRTPSDTQKRVKDEHGVLFMDNVIDVKITRNGNQAVLDKQFTKETFAQHVDGSFLSHAILEGLVFDEAKEGKLLFAASVCYPQTDIFIPLRVTVAPNGSMHIERIFTMEEELPTTQNSGEEE